MADKELELNETENVVEESVVEEDTTVEETVVEEEATETEAAEEFESTESDETLDEAKSKKEDADEDDEEDDDEDDDEKDLKASYGKKEGWKKGKPMKKEDIDVQEHVDAMLNGQDLSEEFKEKAQTIFEAAVLEKINEEVDKLESKYEETLEENLVEIRTEISEKVDEYLTYVAKEWLEENKLAVENGLKLEIMENFQKGLKAVFVENYVDIPEEKLDLYAESVSNLEETETKLNDEIKKSVELAGVIADLQKEVAIRDITEGLTLTQSEKLRSLSEGVEFVSPEDFSEKLTVLKENYFPSEEVEVETEISDETEAETALEDSPVVMQEEASKNPASQSVMDIYASTLTRFAKN